MLFFDQGLHFENHWHRKKSLLNYTSCVLSIIQFFGCGLSFINWSSDLIIWSDSKCRCQGRSSIKQHSIIFSLQLFLKIHINSVYLLDTHIHIICYSKTESNPRVCLVRPLCLIKKKKKAWEVIYRQLISIIKLPPSTCRRDHLFIDQNIFPDQQHQYQLRTCQTCKFSGPSDLLNQNHWGEAQPSMF